MLTTNMVKSNFLLALNRTQKNMFGNNSPKECANS